MACGEVILKPWQVASILVLAALNLTMAGAIWYVITPPKVLLESPISR